MQRVLLVDDSDEMLDDIESGLRGALADLELEFRRSSSFDDAEKMLALEDFDLVVLDVMDGDSSTGDLTRGRTLYLRIHETRWIPVVFYSGIAQEETDLARPPLVATIVKGDTAGLYAATRGALASNAASTARTVATEIDRLTRRFFRDHVSEYWAAYDLFSADELQRVLVNRLAAWMREWKIGGVEPDALVPIGHEAESSNYYLVPPVAQHGLRSGSVLRSGDDWFIMLTPTCDLFFDDGTKRRTKADYALLGIALPALEVVSAQKSPREILSGHVNRSRWYYLPAFLNIPDIVVDFERVLSVPIEDLDAYERVADLDSPFAEHLVSRHSQWRGRVGKPDIDADLALARILPSE